MDSLPFGDFKLIRGFPKDVSFGGAGGAVAPALVLDGERGELVRAPAARLGKKAAASEARVALALKSHSEAERRRRERINAHLSTLRSLVPQADKLDKAALLAEVISHLRELKNSAADISNGCSVPSDVDQVNVEVEGDGMYDDGSSTIQVSMSCEDRPELIADLKHALQAFRLKIIRAELCTLGGRVKIVFVMTGGGGGGGGGGGDVEQHLLVNSVHQALKSVADRASSPPDFSPRSTVSGKRRRILTPFDSSSSCS